MMGKYWSMFSSFLFNGGAMHFYARHPRLTYGLYFFAIPAGILLAITLSLFVVMVPLSLICGWSL